MNGPRRVTTFVSCHIVLVARFVERAVFGSRSLVRATPQHLGCSLG